MNIPTFESPFPEFLIYEVNLRNLRIPLAVRTLGHIYIKTKLTIRLGQSKNERYLKIIKRNIIMEDFWSITFKDLKKHHGNNLEYIHTILEKNDIGNNLYHEFVRCYEEFLTDPEKEHNFKHIAHVATMLAHIKCEKSYPYIINLLKTDFDYLYYFFDEINSCCMSFLSFKLAYKNLDELLRIVMDESIYEENRSYVLEGLLTFFKVNPESEESILPKLNSLFESAIMKPYIIRYSLIYNVSELYDTALKCFYSSKIHPMELSKDEVEAIKDKTFEYKGFRTLEDLYKHLEEMEEERQEYVCEFKNLDFF